MMPLNVKLTVILLPLAIAPRAVQTLPALRATIAQNAARLAYDVCLLIDRHFVAFGNRTPRGATTAPLSNTPPSFGHLP